MAIHSIGRSYNQDIVKMYILSWKFWIPKVSFLKEWEVDWSFMPRKYVWSLQWPPLVFNQYPWWPKIVAVHVAKNKVTNKRQHYENVILIKNLQQNPCGPCCMAEEKFKAEQIWGKRRKLKNNAFASLFLRPSNNGLRENLQMQKVCQIHKYCLESGTYKHFKFGQNILRNIVTCAFVIVLWHVKRRRPSDKIIWHCHH